MIDYTMVPEAGLEPAWIAPVDFESTASTIPPLGHLRHRVRCGAGICKPPRAGDRAIFTRDPVFSAERHAIARSHRRHGRRNGSKAWLKPSGTLSHKPIFRSP